MTGNNSKPSRFIGGVSLKEHLVELFSQRFQFTEEAIKEAKRLMESKMAGFPTEYAKKLELEQTALLVKELKDNDLNLIKSSIEKKLSKEEYETRHEILLQKAQGWEKIEANINGRLWSLGIGMTVLVIIAGVVFRYVFKL